MSKTYRRANIRSAAHIPAKLETIGIRMEPGDRVDCQTKADLSRLREVHAAGLDDPRIQDLARIEHERWMIERKLAGWQYGTPRDNERLIHPLLVPWEQLRKYPAEAAKDVAQTLAAIDHLLTRQV
ncbi:RyR domain-containing protein [Hoeflea sp.]|uniref:RyR domain-containing protein n=1 Tax=Hoeflea sp. TaxID=1940281 RepID=UPI003A952AC2